MIAVLGALSVFVRFNFGLLNSSMIMIGLIAFYEWNRIRRIVRELDERETSEVVARYYRKDFANKSLPWRDQANGINQLFANTQSSEAYFS
ncbi:MAG: hypothetical protein AAFX93_08265 [Verrucomicrobiota bacterium]